MTAEPLDAIALPADPASRRELERRRLEGSYAGAVSRLVGYLIDVFVVTASFTIGAVVFEYVVNAVLPVDLDLDDDADRFRGSPSAFGASRTSRTCWRRPAERSARRSSARASFGPTAATSKHGRAAVRVLATSLSFATFGIGLLLILIRKDRRALHDLIAGTCEVYSWQRR